MGIRIFNTLKNEKECFEPAEANKVKMYVCGPTTYNYIHLGNARPIVCFDAIRKYFIYRGYEVTYIQNFTDIDDKIINKSQEEGIEPAVLAEKYIAEYFKDADALQVKRADKHPKVSEHIDEILVMIEQIIENGHAYVLDGDVYFDVGSFESYGKLSKRNLEDMQAGSRVGVDEKKKSPWDFALWKRVKPGEPSWESPWGLGRPGWHIECSAMSLKYLGPGFDIHGGGADLVFPHHENEIAQAEACNGKNFAKYWMHNGFITINEEKMSKSLGNFFLVRDILQDFSPQVIRFYLLSTHYRSPLDFDDQKLKVAEKGLRRLQNAWLLLEEKIQGPVLAKGDQEKSLKQNKLIKTIVKEAKTKFIQAMDDDFNTSLAIAAIFDFCKEINKFLNESDFALDEEIKGSLLVAEGFFAEVDGVLGFIKPQKEEEESADVSLLTDVMAFVLAWRQEAKKDKNWDLADKIRNDLATVGIKIIDTPQGVKWQKESV